MKPKTMKVAVLCSRADGLPLRRTVCNHVGEQTDITVFVKKSDGQMYIDCLPDPTERKSMQIRDGVLVVT